MAFKKYFMCLFQDWNPLGTGLRNEANPQRIKEESFHLSERHTCCTLVVGFYWSADMDCQLQGDTSEIFKIRCVTTCDTHEFKELPLTPLFAMPPMISNRFQLETKNDDDDRSR